MQLLNALIMTSGRSPLPNVSRTCCIPKSSKSVSEYLDGKKNRTENPDGPTRISSDTNPLLRNSLTPALSIPPFHFSSWAFDLICWVAPKIFMPNSFSANSVISGTPWVSQPSSALRSLRRKTALGSHFEVLACFFSSILSNPLLLATAMSLRD
jgi:hypothetical protein